MSRVAVQRTVARAALVAALAGFVLATPASAAPRVTEFPIPGPAGFPSGIVAGPDGALWFGQRYAPFADRIGRITTAGTISEFRLPFGSGPAGITVGPDGALWFTEQSANKIGRITTTGAVSEFPIPTPESAPVGIVTGPDGALWFTESQCSVPELPELFCDGGKIGRITTTGAVTEFAVPVSASRGSAPWGIVAGPDGALWFTEQDAGRIGRITTKGTITEYRLPAAPGGGFPWGIVVGPDRALWFGEAGKIGRITTSGTVTEFRLPGANSDTTAIAVGPDEALWFTEFQRNKIGRVTTSGTVTEFSVPTANSGPGGNLGAGGIAAGPDGALWFSEQFAKKIGRITARTPRVSLKLAPRTGCTSTAVRAKVKVTGGATLARIDLSISGRRLITTKRRSFRLRISVRALHAGKYSLTAVAVDTTGARATTKRTFRRCPGAPNFTG